MGTFDTNRSLLKYILLGIITFGIYDVWVLARAGEDLNVIASRWDCLLYTSPSPRDRG